MLMWPQAGGVKLSNGWPQREPGMPNFASAQRNFPDISGIGKKLIWKLAAEQQVLDSASLQHLEAADLCNCCCSCGINIDLY